MIKKEMVYNKFGVIDILNNKDHFLDHLFSSWKKIDEELKNFQRLYFSKNQENLYESSKYLFSK